MNKHPPSRGTFWMLVPIGLLVTSVSGWLYMVSIAVDDPGFAVEPDYFKKASKYDDVMAERAENKRLGYQVQVVSFSGRDAQTADLVLKLTDRDGVALSSATVSAEVLFVARAADRQEVSFRSQGDGVFAAEIARPRSGLWDVKLRAVGPSGESFTRLLRTELHPGDSLGAQRAGEPPS